MDVRSHGPAELAAAVGLVAQEPETQVVSATVRAEIELPLELRGASPAVRARAVEEVALALAIPDLLERTTDTLSGGELQRVALAAALATRPRLVLLDEPTSQLDPVAGDELISLLRRLNEEWGVAVLLGEHRLERCLAAADRVVALDRARSPSTAPRPRSSSGRWGPTPPWRPRERGSCGEPGCPYPRASARPGTHWWLARSRSQRPSPHRALGAGRTGITPAMAPAARAGAAICALAARDLWVELGDGRSESRRFAGVELEVARASGSP